MLSKDGFSAHAKMADDKNMPPLLEQVVYCSELLDAIFSYLTAAELLGACCVCRYAAFAAQLLTACE